MRDGEEVLPGNAPIADNCMERNVSIHVPLILEVQADRSGGNSLDINFQGNAVFQVAVETADKDRTPQRNGKVDLDVERKSRGINGAFQLCRVKDSLVRTHFSTG